ncbi:NAD(P)-binding protein [Pseudovirgaria hyperparasitica]|uniref:NAD(P)-binding protein n=1 Tax=Pseudovirgaria hyperparasitica TaxID=470096 RepID=A0A6A6VWM6_9PEZI|nr:NAD(P)-binding protein [Pseudovirgaria hyperparasitica]KAF2753657.1 NAD(P)-binding protein [Pseudovirgaria hyperparasitica]
MSGTILITGANGSLAIPTVEFLLTNYPEHTLLLTVRNPGGDDINTEKLRQTIARFPKGKATVRGLDLSKLTSVNTLANELIAEIKTGKLPALSSIIGNAYFWNLNKDTITTSDGYEQTFQINHLSHAALVLRLLGSFERSGGRVVLFSSDAHWPGKNGLEKIPVFIPSNLDELVFPEDKEPHDNMAQGFLKYAQSKLVVTMWVHALNRRLQRNNMSNITAIAVNPGNMTDSAALRKNTPAMVQFMSKWILGPGRPLLRFLDPTMRTTKEAAVDIAEFATNKASPGEMGFFTMYKKDESSPDSQKENVQDDLWKKTVEWCRVRESALPLN